MSTSEPTATPPDQPPTVAACDPLSAEHHEELAAAARRRRKIDGAIKLATFNAWTTGIFAATSAIFAFSSLVAAALAGGLAAVSWNEFRGRRRLAQLDIRAPRILGHNQFYMLGVIAGYCVWQIVTVLTQPNPYSSTVQSTPELGPMLGSIGELYTKLTVAVYGALILLSTVFQCLSAMYYFTREKHLRAYLAETPPWVVELQRSSAG